MSKKVEIKGKTLQVYLYLLKNNNAGIREIQKDLKFKSPSLVEYHLKKLEEAGLIYREKGEWKISKEVKPEILKDFLFIGSTLIPRFALYGSFYLVIFLYLMLKFLFSSITVYDSILAVILLLVASIIFIYESIKIYIKSLK